MVKNTLLRVIPTMTFQDVYLDIYGIYSNNLSDIYSDILSGIYSGILSDKWSGILSGILPGIYSDILSDILSDIYNAMVSGILSDILFGILSDILSGILSDINSSILSDVLSRILSGILYFFQLEFYLAYILAFYLAFYLTFYLAGLISGEADSAQTLAGWGPARPTALRLSPVEVRRGPQRSDSCRLRSGEAYSERALAVWVRQGPLRSEGRKKEGGPHLIKSNNPLLARVEQQTSRFGAPRLLRRVLKQWGWNGRAPLLFTVPDTGHHRAQGSWPQVLYMFTFHCFSEPYRIHMALSLYVYIYIYTVLYTVLYTHCLWVFVGYIYIYTYSREIPITTILKHHQNHHGTPAGVQDALGPGAALRRLAELLAAETWAGDLWGLGSSRDPVGNMIIIFGNHLECWI